MDYGTDGDMPNRLKKVSFEEIINSVTNLNEIFENTHILPIPVSYDVTTIQYNYSNTIQYSF